MKDEIENLITRTKKFALRVIKLYSSLPKTVPAQVIGKQILRSATSVGANYREAYRSRSKQEFTSTLGICLKELEETAYWLDLLVESEIVAKEKLEQLIDECDQLISIFVTIIKKRRTS